MATFNQNVFSSGLLQPSLPSSSPSTSHPASDHPISPSPLPLATPWPPLATAGRAKVEGQGPTLEDHFVSIFRIYFVPSLPFHQPLSPTLPAGRCCLTTLCHPPLYPATPYPALPPHDFFFHDAPPTPPWHLFPPHATLTFPCYLTLPHYATLPLPATSRYPATSTPRYRTTTRYPVNPYLSQLPHPPSHAPANLCQLPFPWHPSLPCHLQPRQESH